MFKLLYKKLKHDTLSKCLPEWDLPNLCEKERKFHFNICIYICMYVYIHMYIHSSLFSPHITQPLTQHTQIHQTCHQFPLPTCKIHAKNPGQCNMGHWAQVVSPYQPTTIPKNCHKNTRCMSLAQSISIGLTSQQIIQLGQLCYPVGTQLFKHPWTDERSCKTSLHAVDICWWDHPHVLQPSRGRKRSPKLVTTYKSLSDPPNTLSMMVTFSKWRFCSWYPWSPQECFNKPGGHWVREHPKAFNK